MTTKNEALDYRFNKLIEHPANVFRKYVGEPTQFQLALFDLLLSEGPSKIRSVAKHHRCVGLTSAITVFIAWYALKHHDRTIANIDLMHKQDTIYRMVMNILDQVDAEFRFSEENHGMYHRRTKTEIDLFNNNRVLFRSTSPKALHGMTISLGVLNDIPTDSELFYRLIPAMASSRFGLVLQIFEKDPPAMADLVTTAEDVLYEK
jgi:hypothetical protein